MQQLSLFDDLEDSEKQETKIVLTEQEVQKLTHAMSRAIIEVFQRNKDIDNG